MRILMLLALAIGILSGCATGPTEPDPEQIAAEQAARSALKAGDYSTAAESFQKLAEDSYGEQANEYQLTAVEAYIKADYLEQARTLLEPLEFDAEEQPRLFVRERLLEAELALASDDAALALERLEGAYPAEDQMKLRAEYHLLRARAFEQQGNPIGDVSERLAADQALAGQPQRLQHAETLWSKLRRLERTELNQLRKGASEPAAGWLELALIEQSGLTNIANLQRTLDDWQLSYPGHPAAKNILPQLRKRSESLDQALGHVGLLLPLNSNYAEAARIIRDGFLAAWYESGGERPEIRIYDSSESDVVDVYNHAIDDGADMIVGPLEKTTLADLIEQGEISVPTLALNFYDGQTDRINTINGNSRLPQLYQFSLSPEDEARQVAERAWADGHQFALALTPANDWGDRLYKTFARRYEQLGGEVAKHVVYSTTEQNFASAVQALLNIDSSKQRFRELQETLQRQLHTETRGIGGGGFIMLAGTPAAGRQIGPQLLYYRAETIPVYATSHIYEGVTDRTADADMNGFMFVDMPWLLDDNQKTTPLYTNIDQYWGDRLHSDPRLYAFGIDAYRILSQLGRLALDQSLRFNGMSGRLSVGEDGRIHRQLMWARFMDGVPRLLDDSHMVQH